MEVGKMIFLSKWVIYRFQPLIFQGVSLPGPPHQKTPEKTKVTNPMGFWLPQPHWNCHPSWSCWPPPSWSQIAQQRRITPPTFHESSWLVYRIGSFSWFIIIPQWLFLVPLIGGKWYIITGLAIYHLYIAFWVIICWFYITGWFLIPQKKRKKQRFGFVKTQIRERVASSKKGGACLGSWTLGFLDNLLHYWKMMGFSSNPHLPCHTRRGWEFL